MAKKSYRFSNNDYDDDMDYRTDYYEELQERRKMKRMRNAIRSKNLDDLMWDDDDFDDRFR